MSAIDHYLDRLLLELRARPVDARRILAEVEDHLREAAADGMTEGLPPDEAERRAVERFGPPRTVASRSVVSLPSRSVTVALLSTAVPFGALGLIAIGASGVVAEVLGLLFGPAFVAGDLPWQRYTTDRCAQLQAYFPGKSCGDAAAWHHWGEVVGYRVAAGVLGLLVLGGFLLYRRMLRRLEDSKEWVLPAGTVPVVGVVLYGLASAVLLLEGLNAVAGGGAAAGGGQWFSAAAVALAAAGLYGRQALRTLRSA